jgi:lipopolysaccharide export system permease protein
MTVASRGHPRRLPRKLSAYILREVVGYTLLGLMAITVIFLSQNLLRLLDELMAVGFSSADLFAVLRCLIPMLLSYTLPVAFLFGVLLATTRMASDQEIIAMRACGLGLREVLAPVVALGFAISCGSWYLQLEVEHAARRELRDVVQSMVARGSVIEGGRFSHLGDRVLYVDHVDRDNRLERIVIADRSDPKRPVTIFAESGRFSFDPERAELRLRLQSGDVHIEPQRDDDRYRRIAFLSIDYSFDVELALRAAFGSLRPYDMTIAELREIVARAEAGGSLDHLAEKNPAAYQVHIHRRFAMPLAPTLFAMVGIPLGLRRTRGARSWGALLCVAMTFLYYLLLKGSEMLALEGVLPAALAIWIPNAVFAAAGLALLSRARYGEA